MRSVSWSYGEWFLVMLGTLCTLGMLAVAFVYFRIRIQEYFSASPKKSENKSKK